MRRAVGQKRKCTGECYTVHTLDVAKLIEAFSESVAQLVGCLTAISKHDVWSRAVRKAIDRMHCAKAPADAQLIKCCDLISNL